MAEKAPEPKEKPASKLTDAELAKRLFPAEILEWIEDQESDENDGDA